MKSSKPEIPWRRVEPSFLGAAEPQAAASPHDAPMPAPARANRWFGIILPIAIVLAVAGGGAYWALYKMPAASQAKVHATPPPVPKPGPTDQAASPAAPAPKPAAPLSAPSRPDPNQAATLTEPASAPKPAEGPRLVGPAAPPEAAPPPDPASAATPPPNLVEGSAPLLAPVPRWEQEVVITPPPPSREEMPEPAPPPRRVRAPRPAPSAPPPTSGQSGGIRF